jgi:hypothetical protein
VGRLASDEDFAVAVDAAMWTPDYPVLRQAVR